MRLHNRIVPARGKISFYIMFFSIVVKDTAKKLGNLGFVTSDNI